MLELKRFTAKEMPEKTFICAKNYIKGRILVKQFQNNCTEEIFVFLFDEEEGKRLWKHYVTSCSRDMEKFLTYLTDEQANEL